MKFKIFLVGTVFLAAIFLIVYLRANKNPKSTPKTEVTQETINNLNPLTIQAMRGRSFPGSEITIEQKLSPGANYDQYITSYLSDGLKIYALLTIPNPSASSGLKEPANGWPVILFNHGYIPPEQYSTTQKYVAYVDYFAKNGYVVFKPDFRGNGKSEGQPTGAYFSPNYTIDDLNALASIKQYPGVNPNKIGVGGHSLGGNLTLRMLVTNTQDIKAAVIWGGVVGSYDDIINNWQRRVSYQPAPEDLALRNQNRQKFLDQYGTPRENPDFWNSIDPTYFINDITAPVQLNVGSADNEVPPDFSQSFYDKLISAGKTAEFYTYPGSDHNISQSFNLAMQRSLEFFNRYLKS